MSRLIIILIIIFLLLTVIRSVIMKFRSNPDKNKSGKNSGSGKNGTEGEDEISDAKFEEIK